ncbi:MAG: hypothetical protein IJU13_06010 [Bacteroidales bacterium]|nr:hypothetical protein [Bacteroidales bacterium]
MSEERRKDFLVNYIVDQLTVFVMEDYRISLDRALELVYTSRLYGLLLDEEADLTSESPSYLYEILKKEMHQ